MPRAMRNALRLRNEALRLTQALSYTSKYILGSDDRVCMLKIIDIEKKTRQSTKSSLEEHIFDRGKTNILKRNNKTLLSFMSSCGRSERSIIVVLA